MLNIQSVNVDLFTKLEYKKCKRSVIGGKNSVENVKTCQMVTHIKQFCEGTLQNCFNMCGHFSLYDFMMRKKQQQKTSQ